jgi:hypothetical protein
MVGGGVYVNRSLQIRLNARLLCNAAQNFAAGESAD